MSDFSHVPAGYHSVTPSITVKDATGAIEFYKEAFGAKEKFRMPDKKTGGILHAEIAIGNSVIMLSSEYPDLGATAPAKEEGGLFMIYIENCDSMYQQALEAGASSLEVPADQFWGDRTARVADPHGYRWTLAQKVRDVTPEELGEYMASLDQD